jgi:hypothetical protein
MNNRPDLLSEASLVRAFKLYLGKIKAPVVTLSAPTTSMTIDPSVTVDLIRSNKSGLLLQLLFSEMLILMKRHTKLSLLPNKNFTIPFAGPASMLQLARMTWILLKGHSDMWLRTRKTSSLCL